METENLDPKSEDFRQKLRLKLTPLQYSVTQEKATERPFSNKYYKWKEDGTYCCIVCGTELFTSSTKFDSGSGWPAFYDVIDNSRIKLKQDASHVGANILLLISNPNLVRTEVSCSKCGSHLGHVFSDGPKPTGKRYCVNSASMDFRSQNANAHPQTDNADNNDNTDDQQLPYTGGCSCACLPKTQIKGS